MSNAEEKLSKASTDMLPLLREIYIYIFVCICMHVYT